MLHHRAGWLPHLRRRHGDQRAGELHWLCRCGVQGRPRGAPLALHPWGLCDHAGWNLEADGGRLCSHVQHHLLRNYPGLLRGFTLHRPHLAGLFLLRKLPLDSDLVHGGCCGELSLLRRAESLRIEGAQERGAPEGLDAALLRRCHYAVCYNWHFPVGCYRCGSSSFLWALALTKNDYCLVFLHSTSTIYFFITQQLARVYA
mmetsp:Transcript_13962/g.30837  ORF Transcript_13962/g.30837 Transcript_13962/m.30837 type:complete len:202 (-) Transcript_13962:1647-2252(-)